MDSSEDTYCINLFLTGTLSSSFFFYLNVRVFYLEQNESPLLYIIFLQIKNQINKTTQVKPPATNPLLPFCLQVKCSVFYNLNRRETCWACVWYSRAHLSPLCVWNTAICGNTYTNCGNRALPPNPNNFPFCQEVFWQFLKGSLY